MQIERSGQRQYTERYQALMDYYHMQPSTNNPGEAHGNGDVEQSHFRFKDAVDQVLRLRGSRDFGNRSAYLCFLSDLVRLSNQTRQPRWVEEHGRLSPCHHATRSGPGSARECQSLFHHPGVAQYLLGPVAPDWTHAHRVGARGSA